MGRKCLITDLDGTMWGGVLGEGDIVLDNPYREYQHKLLTLHGYGVLLAICSKGDWEDAKLVIRDHPEMVLRPGHFSAVRMDWGDKVSNIDSIATFLGIGLDSLVFVDDSPRERALVQGWYPEIIVISPDVDVLDFFDASITMEDRMRGTLYSQRSKRLRAKKKFNNIEDFYASLDLHVEIREVDDLTAPRVAQLSKRVNRFNLTGEQYTIKQIKSIGGKWQKVYTVQARDCFGDMGIVGAVILRRLSRAWIIEGLFLSCRAIGFGIEDAFLAHIADELKAPLWAVSKSTGKNAVAVGFIRRCFDAGSHYYIAERPKWIQIV